MKIWIMNHYAIPPSMGGLVRHYYFSKYLQKKGHKVQIFTSSKIHNTEVNMIEGKELYKKQKVDGITYTFVKTSDYKGNGIKRIINMLEFPIRMWRVQRYFKKPDVIYTSSPDLFTALSGILLAKFLKLPCVVEVRDLWPESIVEYNGMSRKNPVIQILYQLEKWIYKQADKLIFTMEGGKDYIRDKGWDKDVNLRKVHHVNNGVDLEEFEFNKKHFQIKDNDLEDEAAFKVVYTGSVRKTNHIETLIRAVEACSSKSKIKLFLYGEGNEKEKLEEYCNKHKLDNIFFRGRVEKQYIPYILSKSDLNILNYQQAKIWKYGGSQNKLFEYLASKKPVCSNVEMGHSLIKKYRCGYEKNIESCLEYAKVIKQFSSLNCKENEAFYERIESIIQKYDYKRLTEQIERILIESLRKQKK